MSVGFGTTGVKKKTRLWKMLDAVLPDTTLYKQFMIYAPSDDYLAANDVLNRTNVTSILSGCSYNSASDMVIVPVIFLVEEQIIMPVFEHAVPAIEVWEKIKLFHETGGHAVND